MNGLVNPYWAGSTIFGAVLFAIVVPLAFGMIDIRLILAGASFGAMMGYFMARFFREDDQT